MPRSTKVQRNWSSSLTFLEVYGASSFEGSKVNYTKKQILGVKARYPLLQSAVWLLACSNTSSAMFHQQSVTVYQPNYPSRLAHIFDKMNSLFAIEFCEPLIVSQVGLDPHVSETMDGFRIRLCIHTTQWKLSTCMLSIAPSSSNWVIHLLLTVSIIGLSSSSALTASSSSGA